MMSEVLRRSLVTKAIGSVMQRLNYRYELHPIQKRVHGVGFHSYDLLPPTHQIILEELLENASPGDIVFDVGAHKGNYALPLAAADCQVVAFEPNPNVLDELQKNARANGFDTIQFQNLGLSDTDDKLTFYESSKNTLSSFNKYNAQRKDGEIVGTRTVPVKQIDTLVHEKMSPPDHLKVDVEGLGLEVLRGASETILEHRPTIYFEPHEIKEGELREDELTAFFESHDYSVEVIEYPWICQPR